MSRHLRCVRNAALAFGQLTFDEAPTKCRRRLFDRNCGDALLCLPEL